MHFNVNVIYHANVIYCYKGEKWHQWWAWHLLKYVLNHEYM